MLLVAVCQRAAVQVSKSWKSIVYSFHTGLGKATIDILKPESTTLLYFVLIQDVQANFSLHCGKSSSDFCSVLDADASTGDTGYAGKERLMRKAYAKIMFHHLATPQLCSEILAESLTGQCSRMQLDPLTQQRGSIVQLSHVEPQGFDRGHMDRDVLMKLCVLWVLLVLQLISACLVWACRAVKPRVTIASLLSPLSTHPTALLSLLANTFILDWLKSFHNNARQSLVQEALGCLKPIASFEKPSLGAS